MIFYKNDMFEKIIFFEYCVFISNVVILHSLYYRVSGNLGDDTQSLF